MAFLRFLVQFLITFTEPINSTGTIDKFLFAGIEGMTFAAYIDVAATYRSFGFNFVST